MTANQKDILITLALANILILCCAAPNVFYYFNIGGVQEQAQLIAANYLPTLGPTSTPRPSASPTRLRPTPTLETGWRLYAAPHSGFLIALPPGWNGVELDPATLDPTIQKLKQTSPSLEAVLRQNGKEFVSGGIRFFGADLTSGPGLSTNVNVAFKSLQRDTSLDSLVQANLGDLANRPEIIKPVEHWRTVLEVGEIEEFHWRAAPSKPGAAAVFTSQYLIARSRDEVVITLTTAPDQEKKYTVLFDKIGKSFRWIIP